MPRPICFATSVYTLVRSKKSFSFTDQVYAALQPITVNDDLNAVAITDLANRSTRQGFRCNVPDACPGRNAGKARIRQNGHMLAKT